MIKNLPGKIFHTYVLKMLYNIFKFLLNLHKLYMNWSGNFMWS